ADVILPASSYLEKLGTYTNTDRRVQIGRPVISLPGDARLDWKIISELSTRMGYEMNYDSPKEIFDEFASLSDSYSTLEYDHLGNTGRLWPNADPANEDGPVVLFGDGFPTASGRGKFVAAEWTAAPELPDDEYPFILNTGRLLEHWHTGAMTRRARALHKLQPNAFVGLHPDDAEALNVHEGQLVRVSSRRGEVTLGVRISPNECRGSAFMPFHFREAAANVLTLDELDPEGKIPSFKFCAVQIEAVED
ncbi:MAG: molybdopterin dinucleotide binding domain-containing protein, partial [Myxococcota bacterium]